MLGNPHQLCYYKLIAWLFGRLVIKWSPPLGRFVHAFRFHKLASGYGAITYN